MNEDGKIDVHYKSASNTEFIIGLVGLSLLMGISIGYTRVITSQYALQLNAQGWMLAVIAVAQSIGMLVLASPAGKWVNRYGVRRVFVIATLWAMFVSILTPFFPNFIALAVFTALSSLAMPPRFVSINTVFMSRLSDLGEQRAGWFRASHVIGMTFLGAVLATTLFPITGPFVSYSVASVIFAANILFLYIGIAKSPSGLKKHKGKSAQNLFHLFSLSDVRRVAILEFSIQALNAYFVFYIVIIVIRYLRLPESIAGFAVGFQGIALVSTMIFSGTLGVQYPVACKRIGGMIVILGLILVSNAADNVFLYLASVALGTGLGLLQVINLRDFAKLGKSIGFSEAAAVNALSGPSGGVFGGLLGGLFEAMISPQQLFLAFVPMILYLMLKDKSIEGKSRG